MTIQYQENICTFQRGALQSVIYSKYISDNMESRTTLQQYLHKVLPFVISIIEGIPKSFTFAQWPKKTTLRQGNKTG
jgi:hypothetical protein